MNDFPTCGLLVGGAARFPWGELPALRTNPKLQFGKELFKTLRTADERTVVGLAAVSDAIERAGWQDRSFAEWGVIGSCRSFGRIGFTAAIDRFRRRGPNGVSPLIVPNYSLHAIASAISIALGANGPHFGVSGNANHLSEALLTGLGVVEREPLAGLWVVASEFDPEPIPDERGEPTNPVVVQAAALAISCSPGAMELTLSPGTHTGGSLGDLVSWLIDPNSAPWRCAAAGVGVLEMRSTRSAAARAA